MPDSYSFEKSARRLADKFDLPETDGRLLFIELGAALDAKPESLDLIVLQRAYMAMFRAVEEVYRPRTPLEAQLEYEQAKSFAVAEFGVEWPEWDPALTPVRPLCPNDDAVLRRTGDVLTCPLCDFSSVE